MKQKTMKVVKTNIKCTDQKIQCSASSALNKKVS